MPGIYIAIEEVPPCVCPANVLTDRPVPEVHKFSLLRVLRMLYTPVVVFFCGINAIATSV